MKINRRHKNSHLFWTDGCFYAQARMLLTQHAGRAAGKGKAPQPVFLFRIFGEISSIFMGIMFFPCFL